MCLHPLSEVDERPTTSLMLHADCMVFVNRDDKADTCKLYNLQIQSTISIISYGYRSCCH